MGTSKYEVITNVDLWPTHIHCANLEITTNEGKGKKINKLTKIEELVGSALCEIENSSTELKNDLRNFYLSSVKEFEIVKGGKRAKNTLLIYVPY